MWRGWRRAAGTAWRNRCFRWAATSARRSVHCWAPSWCCRAGRRASRGAPCWPSRGSPSCGRSADGIERGGAARAGRSARADVPHRACRFRRARVGWSLAILAALIFSKYFYLASLSSYYTFYLIEKFHLSVRTAQIQLFVFLAAVAVGTILGGPIGDRIGRKLVIWVSILGVLPFTLLLPYASLFWTPVLAIVIGLILASAFSAIVVFAQELVPGRVGLISGVFFGFAFGMGGIGAAVLGQMADVVGIEAVYRLCAFLPAIGLLAAFLPDV